MLQNFFKWNIWGCWVSQHHINFLKGIWLVQSYIFPVFYESLLGHVHELDISINIYGQSYGCVEHVVAEAALDLKLRRGIKRNIHHSHYDRLRGASILAVPNWRALSNQFVTLFIYQVYFNILRLFTSWPLECQKQSLQIFNLLNITVN